MLVVPKNGENVGRLSLGQCFDIAGNRGGLIPFKMSGWVQGTKRRLPDCPRCHKMVSWDESGQFYVCGHCGLSEGIEKGPITQQLAQKNLITAELMTRLWQDDVAYISSGVAIVISNDDLPDHEYKTLQYSTYDSASSLAPAFAKNTTEQYYTYTATFTAPASDKVIRKIGLGFNDAAAQGNIRQNSLFSVTTLSSEITQTTTETFEVIYKYQFVEVH